MPSLTRRARIFASSQARPRNDRRDLLPIVLLGAELLDCYVVAKNAEEGVTLLEGVLVVLIAGGGAYLGSYLREKGKHYAMREDLDEILAQVRQTTRTTEEIKTHFSGALWVEQARWDLKRDLYYRLLENLDEAKRSINNLWHVLGSWPTAEALQEEWERRQALAEERLDRAVVEIHRARAVAGMMLSERALQVLNELYKEKPKGRHEGVDEWLEEELEATQRVYDLLVDAAKQDLLGVKLPR